MRATIASIGLALVMLGALLWTPPISADKTYLVGVPPYAGYGAWVFYTEGGFDCNEECSGTENAWAHGQRISTWGGGSDGNGYIVDVVDFERGTDEDGDPYTCERQGESFFGANVVDITYHTAPAASRSDGDTTLQGYERCSNDGSGSETSDGILADSDGELRCPYRVNATLGQGCVVAHQLSLEWTRTGDTCTLEASGFVAIRSWGPATQAIGPTLDPTAGQAATLLGSVVDDATATGDPSLVLADDREPGCPADQPPPNPGWGRLVPNTE